MRSTEDYVLYDKANDHIVTDSQGQIIFYADKQEAINDKYGNEIVIKYNKLTQFKNLIK